MANRKMIYLDDALEAIRKLPNAGIHWFASAEAVFDALLKLPSVQPEIIRCKDCIHRPIVDDPDAKDGFGLLFPDFKCPCRCDDGYYSWMPNDNWFCGNGENEAVKDEQ